jgi:hypothetical protein
MPDSPEFDEAAVQLADDPSSSASFPAEEGESSAAETKGKKVAEVGGTGGANPQGADVIPVESAASKSVDQDDESEEDEDDEGEDDEDDDEDEEDEEPRLKYARLTPHLGAVYRNGDATSAFMVAGDKMVGTGQLELPRLG